MPDASTNSAPVIIIGGGISGLACAFRLKQLGVPFLLLEKSNSFGGVIQTVERDGFLFETGPQSFTLTPELAELIEAAGLTGELLRTAPRMPRYIYSGGKLIPAPLSAFSLLTTPLLDARTKWNLFTEIFRTTHPPKPDESIAAFVRRKFGNSLLTNLVAPFVSGVYAGDPEQLSLNSAFPQVHKWETDRGSVFRGAIKQMRQRRKSGAPKANRGICSLNRGIGSLMQALGKQLGDSTKLGMTVNSVRLDDAPGKWQFEVNCNFATQGSNGSSSTLIAKTVICATDTDAAGPMLAGSSLQFPKSLAKIFYAPVAVVSLGYRSEAIGRALDGFGFLVPREEKLRLLGCVWNSALFPGRSPEANVQLTCFVGGATDPEICNWSEEKIAATIHEELTRVLGIREVPIARHVQIYKRAIPQYNLGHFGIMTELKWTCDATPGIFLAGNYLEGPSIGACVTRSFHIADEVKALLSSRS